MSLHFALYAWQKGIPDIKSDWKATAILRTTPAATVLILCVCERLSKIVSKTNFVLVKRTNV